VWQARDQIWPLSPKLGEKNEDLSRMALRPFVPIFIRHGRADWLDVSLPFHGASDYGAVVCGGQDRNAVGALGPMMNTTWSQEKIEDFRKWHDQRLRELQYPDSIIQELTRARERWLPPQQPSSVAF
jgi:hypothetical protein